MYLDPRAADPIVTIVTEATWLPVSLATVKDHLGGIPAADTSRDTELTAFILAAMRAVEGYADIRIRRATVRAEMPAFHDRWRLTVRPWVSTGALEYVAAETGEITTITSTVYHSQRAGQLSASIVLGRNQEWPDDVAIRDDAVRVTYDVGYADAASVPPDIVQAILMTVAKLDANRGDCGCDGGGNTSVYAMKNSRPSVLPEAAGLLLQPYLYMSLSFV
jgi:hypothetical protein